MKVVGLMSGTSCDGVDAALVDIRGRGQSLQVKPLAFQTLAYPASLQQRIMAVSVAGSVTDVCHLNVLLGEWFAKAALRVIKEGGLRPSAVDLIGSHGQTVHHLPNGRSEVGFGKIRSTLQIGEPAVIAERTGVTTVANFRARDMAVGGEGAPFAPYIHYVLLTHPRRSRVIVNLGGISNVTFLPSGGPLTSIRAFDTGPGNMVLDAIIQRHTRGRTAFDRGGRVASRGKVDPPLLRSLMAHPFILRRPPKSTGREEFGALFVDQLFRQKRVQRMRIEDLLATCAAWTAGAVRQGISRIGKPIDEIIVGGGGVRNRAIMRTLTDISRPVPVRTFNDVGWDSKSFEAVAFAVLAYQTISGQPANVPAVTGAKHPVVLGAIVPGKPAGSRARWRRL